MYNSNVMKIVKVSELRRRLPEYLAKVRHGEQLRVISRGKIIADISPPPPTRDEIEAARARLRGSVRRYEMPLDPVVALEDWDVNR